MKHVYQIRGYAFKQEINENKKNSQYRVEDRIRRAGHARSL